MTAPVGLALVAGVLDLVTAWLLVHRDATVPPARQLPWTITVRSLLAVCILLLAVAFVLVGLQFGGGS